MPVATLSQVSVDPVLTQISVMHALEADDFVHHRVFPVVPVDQRDGFYFSFDRADSLRPEAARRAPGAHFNRKTQGISPVQLNLQQWALEMALADELRSSQDSPLADEQPLVVALTTDLLLRRELQFMESYMAPGAATPWANADFTGVNATPDFSAREFLQWDDAAATPIADVKRWVRDVQIACGKRPNVLVLEPNSFDAIAESSAVLSRLPDDATKDVTKQVVAALCGLDEVLVPEAVYNTANEGATYSGEFAMGAGTGLLAYRASSPARFEPSAGYTFSWSEFDSVRADVAPAGAAAIMSYRDETIMSDVFRGMAYFDLGVCASSAGVRIVDILP